MSKFILMENAGSKDQSFTIIEGNSAPEALLDHFTEIFFLDDEEMSEAYIVEDLLLDQYYAIAPVELGDVEFAYYNNLKEIEEEVEIERGIKGKLISKFNELVNVGECIENIFSALYILGGKPENCYEDEFYNWITEKERSKDEIINYFLK